MKINLSEIRIDGGTQSRVELNQDVVAEYAEAYSAGKRMPDVSLFFDGTVYWLADGFHRYFGAKKAGKESIDAEAKDGTQRDAWLYSLGANAEHGLPRTHADKRKAVLMALADAEIGQMTSRQVGEICSVSHTLVIRVRDESEQAVEKANLGINSKTRNDINSGNKNAPTPDALTTVLEPDDDVPKKLPPPAPVDDEEAIEAKANLLDALAAIAVLHADDKYTALIEENQKANRLIAALRSQLDEKMRELNGAIQQCKSQQRRLEKYERAEKEKF